MLTSHPPLPRRLTRAAGDALLERWRSSGLDLAAFCRESGLPEPRLRRLAERRRRQAVGVADAGFARVVRGSGIRVRTLHGAAVEVDADFDAALLRQVVEALC